MRKQMKSYWLEATITFKEVLSSQIILSVSSIVSYLVYELYWKRRTLPPGPVPLLIFGNVLNYFFHKSVDAMFLYWKQRYGNVITFWMGPIPVIVVNDAQLMRHYFIRNAELFSNRWRNYATDTFMGGPNGVIQIDGEKWKEQRRFSLRVLRDFGVGRKLIEDRIMVEVDRFVNHLMERQHQPVDVCQMHAVCVGNVINALLFGYSFPQGSKKFAHLHSLLDTQSRLVIHPLMGLHIVLPFTSKIPLINYKWKQFMDLRNNLWTHISNEVEEHIEHLNDEEKNVDFTYVYLSEMRRREESDEYIGHFSEWQMKMLLVDLFFAGMETTVTTLKWAFLLALLHPEVQTKVQHELDQIGTVIKLADKCRCPYTLATINEIQRIANILSINLFRSISKDVTIDEYHYTAGTISIPQISVAMNDPENFENPEQFMPERFLEADGITLKKYDAFLPFSIGKRQCLGESLAKAELFLIFANLLRRFRFSAVPNQPPPSTERLLGLTTSPPPYQCIADQR